MPLCMLPPNGWRLRSTPAQRPVGVGMPLRGTGDLDTASQVDPAGAERDNATLPEPASSHKNCLTAKRAQTPTRRVHAVLARSNLGKCLIKSSV